MLICDLHDSRGNGICGDDFRPGSPLRRLLHLLLVAVSLAGATLPVQAQGGDPLQPQQDPSSLSLEGPWYQAGEGLRGDLAVACPDGGPPRVLTLAWEPEVPDGLRGYGHRASVPGGDLDLVVPQRSLDALCHAEGMGPEEGPLRVESHLRLEGTCSDGSRLSGDQKLSFDLFCDGLEAKVKTPTTTVGDGPPQADLQLFSEFSARRIFPGPGELDDGWGGEVALRIALGPETRNWLRLALGRSDLSGEVPLVPASFILPIGTAGEILGRRLDVDLDVTTLDAVFGRDLVPSDRKVVPNVFAGVGYAWLEAEGETREGEVILAGESAGGVEGSPIVIGDSLRDLDDGGLTAVAGLALRLALTERCYLDLGARERWFEAREDDDLDTEVFFRVGVPIRK